MGEYALYRGERVKIGTCEEMYYLRADQAIRVQWERGNVHPVRDRAELRFRFPWPDEDATAPGAFDSSERAVPVWGVTAPAGVDHGSVQFTAAPGYLVSLKCPESPEIAALPLKIHRNGFGGAVKIVQQRYVDGLLVLIAMCGGCGEKWRLSTLADAEPYIEAMMKEAERSGGDGSWYGKIAERIRAGYDAAAVAKVFGEVRE